MAGAKERIFTFHEEILQKEEKEKLLNQRGLCLWLTGLSGSGKSTIAKILERLLHEAGYITALLDGDNVRDGLNANLGFSPEGRRENIRRIAEVNKLMNNCGLITINCFVSPTKEIRDLAESIIGSESFLEVFVNTSLATCEARDTKGLYKKARAGEIPNFTGISAPFEIPQNPALIVSTEDQSPQKSAEEVLEFTLPKLKIN
jgi:adenylylsulfate kinase